MTALVGVLNKRAAAIAADSAMTVTNNGVRKIYNNCQKIFPISENKRGLRVSSAHMKTELYLCDGLHYGD